MRVSDEYRRAINGLEGPACRCFDHWDPDEGPPPHCRHIRRAVHSLDLAQWADLLALLAPEWYDDLPVAASAVAVTPGTSEKIAIMAERVARGESPFHPGDLILDDLSEHFGFQPENSHGETKREPNGRVTIRGRRRVLKGVSDGV